MQKISLYITATLMVFFVSSCNTKARKEKQADKMLDNIQLLISQNNYKAAKTEIDSIHSQFPLLVSKRKIAVALNDTITRRECARSIVYCDSILPIKKHQLDSLRRNFRFEKIDQFQEYGNYVNKYLLTMYNTSRNYLKCYVNENADLYLISYLTGRKYAQKFLKITAGGVYIETDTTNIDPANFNSFSNEGEYYESRTYENGPAGKICQFIAEHQKDRVRVDVIGKRTAVYYLTNIDKKAIAQTYNFWLMKKEVTTLKRTMRTDSIKIGRIKLLYE